MDAHQRLVGGGGEHVIKLRHGVGVRGVDQPRWRARIAFAVALVAAGCASDGAEPEAAPATVERPAVELAAHMFTVDGAPWGIAADGATVWVTDAARGTLLQIDAATGNVLREVATVTGQPLERAATGDGEPAAVTLDERWAWVPTHGPGGGLVRLDRNDPQEQPLTVALPESGFAVAVADGIVWVAGLERQVFAVDPASAEVLRTIDVGGAPRGIAARDGDIWVSLRDEGTVVRLEAATGDEVARVDTGGQPWPIAADQNAVWVATLEGRLLRIDPSRNRVAARATVGTQARDIAVTDGAVWVTSQSGALTRVEVG